MIPLNSLVSQVSILVSSCLPPIPIDALKPCYLDLRALLQRRPDWACLQSADPLIQPYKRRTRLLKTRHWGLKEMSASQQVAALQEQVQQQASLQAPPPISAPPPKKNK